MPNTSSKVLAVKGDVYPYFDDERRPQKMVGKFCKNSFKALQRVNGIVSQMKSYGEKLEDEIVIAKVLRSLATKLDRVVAAIEESKDFSIFSFDELTGYLQAHEARLNRLVEKSEEKAFQVKDESYRQNDKSIGKGYGRGGSRGRERANGFFNNR
ncbi:hypothetical protein RJ639_019835 [Escallonia herrerae]|uniref:Uncharacterized protein n=1 Tax=Escallonia herrerae TaxID=1293975 RepID=A0AA88V7T1_9ASTE|nr:hypothetical protein RJ639_019835 [Escallonia herrerae]